MSQWPHAPGPPSRSPHDNSAARQLGESTSAAQFSPNIPPQSFPPSRHSIISNTAPVRDRLQPGPGESDLARGSEHTPSRSLGVRSILNPSSPTIPSISTLPRTRPHLNSPQPHPFPAPYSQNHPEHAVQTTRSANASPRIGYLSSTEYGPGSTPMQGQGPRRILAPRSPARSISVTKVNPPTGTIDAQKSPFLSFQNRGSSVLSGPRVNQDVPQSGTPPTVVATTSFGFPISDPGSAGRRISGGPVRAPHSQSASPSTSFSSYSQLSQTSPATAHNLPSGHHKSSFLPPTFNSTGSSGAVQAPYQSENQYGHTSGTPNQSGIQLMTLDAGQGPIQVPVDVQSASSVADEKRRRNAGASARFRQRRKEKEKEASQSIAKLEQQLRELTEEREFYREERNYFRQVLYSVSGAPTIPPRPQSPRLRRLLPAQTSAQPDAHWQQTEDRQSGRNVRRRTGDFPSGYTLPPPITTAPPIQAPFGAPNGPPQLPRPYPESQAPPQAALTTEVGRPRPALLDPFTPGRHEGSWHPPR
ncbi:MAG: hypothetical protein M1834_003621 [Cirrosporium novae-zelandiae]|nr:MAG: hypothetical protein M1834_003621 [Cirrosporium novae-zelandiae]